MIKLGVITHYFLDILQTTNTTLTVCYRLDILLRHYSWLKIIFSVTKLFGIFYIIMLNMHFVCYEIVLHTLTSCNSFILILLFQMATIWKQEYSHVQKLYWKNSLRCSFSWRSFEFYFFRLIVLANEKGVVFHM